MPGASVVAGRSCFPQSQWSSRGKKGINIPLRENGNFQNKYKAIAAFLSPFFCSLRQRRAFVPPLMCPELLQVCPWISPCGGFLFVSRSFELLFKPRMFESSRATHLKLLPARAALVSPGAVLDIGKIVLEKCKIIRVYK